MKTIVVTDQQDKINFLPHEIEILSSIDYLLQIDTINSLPLRVLNLCKSYEYQSLGYYTSLLSEARGHKVFPSVLAIQDIESNAFESMMNIEFVREIQHAFKHIQSDEFVLSIYFGKNVAKHYDVLCRKFYMLFPIPLFRVFFKYEKQKKIWMVKKIVTLSLNDIPETHQSFFQEMMLNYFNKKRHVVNKKKSVFFDLAILHNPEEVNAHNYTSPSDKKALKSFIDAGKDLGIHAELIEKNDFKLINEYDGLFIRETTAVNHYTYRFSRRAMAERLVVIDDPLSILKCANKVYLAELLKKYHIRTPNTFILSQQNYSKEMPNITFPCVLKLPDSACSKGVKKVDTPEEMKTTLKEFFKISDLILAQSFMPSEFDWRIGILDNKPLFACRYFMAKGHWQIYNWKEKALKNQVGDADSIPLHKVPKEVLHTATKAAKLIGDGLYGVDLKQIGKKIYIIEINDNASIDSGVEDALLGDALYTKIMQVFLQRMRRQHGYE